MVKKISNWGNYPAVDCNEVQFSALRMNYKKSLTTMNNVIARVVTEDVMVMLHFGKRVTISTLKFDKITYFDRSNGVIRMPKRNCIR